MKIIFTEQNKKIAFSIDGYEYDYSDEEIHDESCWYDANWLTVRIEYWENGKKKSFTDNCLLADELCSLAEDIDAIIIGKETGLNTDFLEPYLQLSLTAFNGRYTVQISFKPNKTKKIYVVQEMSIDELKKMNDTLKMISAQFPEKAIHKS